MPASRISTSRKSAAERTGAARMKQLLLNGARRAGPYLLVELLLPGGTLLAALLWLYNRNNSKPARNTRDTAAREDAACATC